MADKRTHISTHFVVRVVVEQVDTTGVVPHGETVPTSASIGRKVYEVGSAIVKDKILNAAISKAHRHLDLIGE